MHVVKHLRLAAIVCALAMAFTACETYDFGGMLLADSSVEKRFENSMSMPDSAFHASELSAPDHYCFEVATDFHLQDNDWDELGVYLSRSQSQGTFLNVFGGDYMYVAGSSFQRFKDSIDTYSAVHTRMAIGNHEVYKEAYNNSYRKLFGPTCYAFKVVTSKGIDQFIVLDAANGVIGVKQYQWLVSLLKRERSGVRHCFVITHANFFAPASYVDIIASYPLDELMRLVNLFVDHKVTAVFSGHSHVRDITYVKGVPFITVGAWFDSYRGGEYARVHCAADGGVDWAIVRR